MWRSLLDAGAWLEAAGAVTREGALGVLVGCASLLFLGLKLFRFYVALLLAGGGFLAGRRLAELMHVPVPYVGGPAAVVLAVAGWKGAKALAPLVAAAIVGPVVVFVGGAFGYSHASWLMFGGAALTAAALTVLFPRYMAALACSLAGAVGVVAAVGALVRSPSGLLSPGAFAHDATAFAAASLLLVFIGMMAQPALDPAIEA